MNTKDIQTPPPIQDNTIKSCNKFHIVKAATTCQSIEEYYSLSLTTSYSGNPAVGRQCTALQLNYYGCVDVVPSTAEGPNPTSRVETPTPVQDNMVKNCNKFAKINSTTACTSIQAYYNFPLSTFLSWNSAVDSNCAALLVNYYVRVSVQG